jgi:hypothetical protein
MASGGCEWLQVSAATKTSQPEQQTFGSVVPTASYGTLLAMNKQHFTEQL